MPDRRSCLRIACFAPFLSLPQTTLGAPEEGANAEADFAKLIMGWRDDPANSAHLNKCMPGTKGSLRLAPDDARVLQAAQFLAGIPKNRTPIDVAQYMIRELPENQRMEWPADRPKNPQPANPLIIAFFAATRTEPTSGDQTAWCAAFACWTLQRAGVVPNHPNSAGSRSFRTWSTKTTDPQRGDIAVFRNKKDSSRGHVGFFDGFVGNSKTRIFLVGGNQSDQINRKEWNLDQPTLAFDSFRTAPALRDPA